VAAADSFPVINPATGAVFAHSPAASAAQLDDAVAAARRAGAAWAASEETRRHALGRCAELLGQQAEALGQLLVMEQGKPLKQAIGEVRGAAAWLRATAQLRLSHQIIQEQPVRIEAHHVPLGVVGAITPWNFPVILAVWKIAPALLAGNTIVVKPSPFTPLSTLRIGELLRDVLPPGVLNMLAGGDQLGAAMTAHPGIRKISFTGSVATGKRIAAAAAPDLKRITLELGGNDPAIVLPDVDPQRVAEPLFWAAFANSGQVCVAIKRLYVHRSVYQAVLDGLRALARTVVVGDGMRPETQLGPVNNAPQLERVRRLLADARERGAEVIGGEPLRGQDQRGGYFLRPALVTGLGEDAPLVAEEQFGPALPVLPFDDVDDAIERANRSHFGLGGSVWSADPARGRDLVSRLECGTGWVNQHGAFHPMAPFGGARWSGLGYENGQRGLEEFTRLQVVHGPPS
jgi:acyl-CoA reductase-like NAD-dependent aldehyde dehydrogenase